MKELAKFDDQNYQNINNKIKRISIRGVIFIGDKLVMVHTKRANELLFPGGGIESGETDSDTLIREVREETGYQVIPETIKELGYITEIRKSIYDEHELYEGVSYYYYCKVNEECKTEPQYSLDELKAGYHVVFIKPEVAYLENDKVIKEIGPRSTWIMRENFILDILIKNKC